MKKLLGPFLLVLVIPIISAAQGKYNPGFVVTLKGDTLHGVISRNTGSRSPAVFLLKVSLNSGQVKSFSAANAVTVVIAGSEIYKRFVVEMSQDRPGEGTLAAGPNIKPVMDMVFLNLIDSGKNVTLYNYTDKIKERFFVSDRGAKPVELVLHVYPGLNLESDPVRQEIYKRQLQSLAVKYLTQYQSVIEEVQEAAYTKQEIEKVVFDLNGGDKASTFTSAKEYKARSFFGIGINTLGVHNFATVNYLGVSGAAYTNTVTKQAVSGEINLGDDFFLEQKDNAMILRLELHITYSGNSTINDSYSGNLLEQYRTLTASFNPQLLFNIYNSESTRIYLGGGGQIFFLGGAKTGYVADNYDELDPPAYYAMDFTFTTRADIVLNNKLDIYAGYIPPSHQQHNTISAFRFGLTYLLREK